MKKKRWIKWVIAGLLILVIGAGVLFIFFNPKKGLKLVLPSLDEISLINAEIKNDTAYVSIDMQLENKSIFKLSIDTLFYKLSLADSLLFNETKVLNLRQKPGMVSKIEMPLRIPISKTMGTIKSLQKKDSTYINIDAYIVYNTIFGKTKIPVSKKVRIKVPVPPQIKVDDVEVGDISLSNKTVEVLAKLTITNKGEMLDLAVHNIHYSLILGNNLVTSNGIYDKKISIKPSSETKVEIPITVEINKVFKTAWKYVTNEKLNYSIKVSAELDENSFYKKSNMPLNLEASGKASLRKSK